MTKGSSFLDEYGISSSPFQAGTPGAEQGSGDVVGEAGGGVAPFLVKDVTSATKSITPYQRKQQFCFERSVEIFIKKYGVENCAILTVSVPDRIDKDGNRVFPSPDEIKKMFKSLCNGLINKRYVDWVWAREWGDINGRLHWHFVVAHSLGDIRTGFDFEAFKLVKNYKPGTPMFWKYTRQYGRTATKALHAEWDYLKETMPKYGFGRSEFAPVKSAKNIASYVGGYLGKAFALRPDEAKSCRLYGGKKGSVIGIRLTIAIQEKKIGDEKKPILCPRAWRVRTQLRVVAEMLGFDSTEHYRLIFGKRWAYRFMQASKNTSLLDITKKPFTYPSGFAAIADGVVQQDDLFEAGVPLDLPVTVTPLNPPKEECEFIKGILCIIERLEKEALNRLPIKEKSQPRKKVYSYD